MRVRAFECNSCNLGVRHETRDILRDRSSPDAFAQIVCDPISYQLEGELSPLDLAAETNNVDPVARLNRRLADRPGRECRKSPLELRCRLSRRDLTEIPGLRSRRAGGAGPRQVAEPLRVELQLGERCSRVAPCPLISFGVVLARGKENVRGFVDRLPNGTSDGSLRNSAGRSLRQAQVCGPPARAGLGSEPLLRSRICRRCLAQRWE